MWLKKSINVARNKSNAGFFNTNTKGRFIDQVIDYQFLKKYFPHLAIS
jgi:hypothetical protein